MKRITIIAAMAALLLAGAGRLNAQRPVGDTIVGAEPTYMYYVYDWWRCASHEAEAPQWYTMTTCTPFGAAMWLNNQMRQCYSGPSGGIIAHDAGNYITGVQMVTERPIKVLGVAACAFAQQPRDTTFYNFLYELTPNFPNPFHLFLNTRDTSLSGRYTDSLLLLKPTVSDPEYLTGGPWRVEDAYRNILLPTRIEALELDTITYAPNWEAHPFHVIDTAPVMPLYEVMFDKPQVVTDSFIVAGTANNNEGSVAMQYMPGMDYLTEYMWLWNKRPTRYWGISYYYNSEIIGIQTDIANVRDRNVVWYKYRSAPWMRMNSDTWGRLYGSGFIMTHHGDAYVLYAPVIFPIRTSLAVCTMP